MAKNVELDKIKDSIFEDYKKTNEFGQEYWSARDFFKILDYQRWDSFLNVIEKAKESCKNSNQDELDHFRRVTKMVTKLATVLRELNTKKNIFEVYYGNI